MINEVATITIKDEVKVLVTGLHGTDATNLYNKFGVLAKGHFFNPMFKFGAWDGKIRFYKKDGSTYLFLIEQVLRYLKSAGYKFKIVDQRKTVAHYPPLITSSIFAHINHPTTGNPIVLRDYQVNAVNTLISEGYGIVVASTGAGKTLITAAMSKCYEMLNLKTLTIVPNKDLIKQTKATYTLCELDVGEYSGTVKDINHLSVVSTWQALQNNPLLVQTFDAIIVDECHGLTGAKLQSILIDHASSVPHRFGVTGTIPKDEADAMSLHVAVGPIRDTIHAHELIDLKVLSSLKVEVLQLEEDLTREYSEYVHEFSGDFGEKQLTYSQFKDRYFGDFSAEKSYLIRKQSRIAWIAALIQEKRSQDKGNVLCLVGSIPLSRKIAELIPGAIVVNGQDVSTPEKRKVIYDMFETLNDVVVIATFNIAGTGLSIDRIFHLVGVDSGRSFVKVMQGIGRGLRMSSDKQSVVYTDICSDLKFGKKHLGERIKYFNEAKYPFTKRIIKYDTAIKL